MDRFTPRTSNVNNHDATASRPAQPATGALLQQPQHTPKKKNGFFRSKKGIVTILVVLALLAAAWYYFRGNIGGTIDSQYQAVFLSNGQVYFGKMAVVNDSYIKITNVYYIQNANGTAAQSSANANNIELVQLTKAVHGPKDEMVINRDQVLFFENLRDDGQAAKLISGDKK